jgi:hypothetical protein
MTQRAFLIQPLNYTIKSTANTYEALSIEILGNYSGWYYISNSPMGYPQHGEIKNATQTLYLRQKCSLRSAIEEMIADDPLVIDINNCKGSSVIYNAIPSGFKVVLQELIFKHEPKECNFYLNGLGPISFEYFQGKGYLHYELPPINTQINLHFTKIHGIIQAKIYLVPFNIGSLVHTLLPQNPLPALIPTSNYPSRKFECDINYKTIQATIELPLESKLKYIVVEGLAGNITEKMTEMVGNWEYIGDKWIFYPWYRISKRRLSLRIETDSIQDKVILTVYFKAGTMEKIPELNKYKSRFSENLTFRHFCDDSYRIGFSNNKQLKSIQLNDNICWNVFIVYEEKGRKAIIKLEERNGVYPLKRTFSELTIVISNKSQPEICPKPSNLNKYINIKIYTEDVYNQEKGGEVSLDGLQEEISDLQMHLRNAEKEIVRLKIST